MLQEHARTGAWAATAASQPGFHASKHGWERLVPSGLGAEGHFHAAHQVDHHPYDVALDPPCELEFALDTLREKGAGIREWRQEKLAFLRYRIGLLQPLAHACRLAMSPRVLRVCAHVNVAALLFLQILSAWPDLTLSARYILGFPIVGLIEGPPVFRPMVKPAEPVQVSTLLGRSEGFIDTLMHRVSKKRDPVADAA
eukprot:4173957-Heterocapsa_arctica.AAC.1